MQSILSGHQQESMLELISAYLIQTNKCALPSIGMFRIEHTSADLDVANRRMLPPVEEIYFTEKEEIDTKDLINFIVMKRAISYNEAERILSDFCKHSVDLLRAGEKVTFQSFGSLLKDEDNKLVFTPEQLSFPLQPVAANAVLHPHTDHDLLVGDRETTSIAMTEYLTDRNDNIRSNWMIWVLLLGLLATCALIYFYSTHSFYMHGFGNGSSL